MKVKLLTSRAGVDFSQSAGDIVEIGDAEAVRMIEAGQAEPVREARIERAVPKAAPEKAVK